MRVAVTGAGGLLGGRLAEILKAQGLEVLALYRRAPPPPGLRALQVELSDEAALARLFDREQLQAVLHAAALASPDACEVRPEEAEATNARLPGAIARLCRARGLRLVALSTDLVFSGERAPVGEQDRAAPTSVYGRSKLAGEEAALAADPGAALARVGLVLGRGHGQRPSASEAVAWALAAGRRVVLYADELRTPIDPESVADAVLRLITRGGGGRFHLGGAERLSRYELGLRTARLLGLPEAGLVAGRRADHSGPARRPADVSLDSSRARRELGWEPRPLEEALRESRLRAPY